VKRNAPSAIYRGRPRGRQYDGSRRDNARQEGGAAAEGFWANEIEDKGIPCLLFLNMRSLRSSKGLEKNREQGTRTTDVSKSAPVVGVGEIEAVVVERDEAWTRFKVWSLDKVAGRGSEAAVEWIELE